MQDVALAVVGVDVLDRDERLVGVRRRSCLEIDLQHPRILLDLRRRALGQDLAVVQHRDAVRPAPSPPACRARRSGSSGSWRCGAPAPWCRGSRPRSCRRSARRGRAAAARWRARCRSRGCAARRARGWRRARPPCRARPTDVQHRLGLVDDVAIGAVVAQHAPGVPARLGGDADVLQRGGVGQDVGDLVRAGDALAARCGRAASPVMSSPLNRMRPDGRAQHAGQAVEEGALARAVRPDDGADLAALDLEVDVVERGQPAEAHGQALGAQHRCRAAPPRPVCGRRRCSVERTPSAVT